MNCRYSLTILFCAGSLIAQETRRLTLAEADEIALRQHPRIAASQLSAQAASAVVTQTRAALFPLLTGSVTSVGAESDSAVAAGNVTTSSLASRAASGIYATQLITDFGRTNQLTKGAELRVAAQNQTTAATRAQTLLVVHQLYYQTLAAQAVRQVAQATIEARRLTLRQVRALAESALKSTLDVSFAEVALSEAELALTDADNQAQARHARLSAAIGYERDQPFELVDERLPAEPALNLNDLLAHAQQNRPDISSLLLNQQAAQRQAEAERRSRWPALSLVGVGGAIPAGENKLHGSYGAAGLNVSIPFLNGGLYRARQAEAEARAAATGKEAQALAVEVARDVEVAYLDLQTAVRRLDVTAKLVEQAGRSLHLAQARYDLGLSTIVELTQAQLAQTSAQIAAAQAKYDYLSRQAVLAYAAGDLK